MYRFSGILTAALISTNVALVQQVVAAPVGGVLNGDDYRVRAHDKYSKGDYPGALADYNQAIILNPQDSRAYTFRGILKDSKLNDTAGALADYDQAIALDPKFPYSFIVRGRLKEKRLNDFQGALADYNRAIAINPKYAYAYHNRGTLKKQRLNDKTGAIKDLRQAAKLYRAEGETDSLQSVLGELQELGAKE
jgi:tetratricopeptide (TPR) repeat protein